MKLCKRLHFLRFLAGQENHVILNGAGGEVERSWQLCVVDVPCAKGRCLLPTKFDCEDPSTPGLRPALRMTDGGLAQGTTPLKRTGRNNKVVPTFHVFLNCTPHIRCRHPSSAPVCALGHLPPGEGIKKSGRVSSAGSSYIVSSAEITAGGRRRPGPCLRHCRCT